MATIVDKKPFVYGDFIVSGLGKIGLTPPPAPGLSPFAIEILREFSSAEFIGKVYKLTDWQEWKVLSPADAAQSNWYQSALKTPKAVKFKMQGSGQWVVENVRTESDGHGPYVAVALKNI